MSEIVAIKVFLMILFVLEGSGSGSTTLPLTQTFFASFRDVLSILKILDLISLLPHDILMGSRMDCLLGKENRNRYMFLHKTALLHV
jgi:hypothetical protein